MYEAMQLFLNRNIGPKMGALVIGKMVPCTCPCTASWQIHGHGDRQKKYKNELLLLLPPFKAQEISDSMHTYTFSRRRRKNRGSIYICLSLCFERQKPSPNLSNIQVYYSN